MPSSQQSPGLINVCAERSCCSWPGDERLRFRICWVWASRIRMEQTWNRRRKAGLPNRVGSLDPRAARSWLPSKKETNMECLAIAGLCEQPMPCHFCAYGKVCCMRKRKLSIPLSQSPCSIIMCGERYLKQTSR